MAQPLLGTADQVSGPTLTDRVTMKHWPSWTSRSSLSSGRLHGFAHSHDVRTQKVYRHRLGERSRCVDDIRRHPIRIGNRLIDVAARRRVLFVYPGELLRSEATRRSDQRRPQTAMYQRHVLVDEAAYEDLWRVTQFSQHGEYLPAVSVGPPAAADRLAGDDLRHPRDRSLRGNEDDTLLPNERQCLGELHGHDALPQPNWNDRVTTESHNLSVAP